MTGTPAHQPDVPPQPTKAVPAAHRPPGQRPGLRGAGYHSESPQPARGERHQTQRADGHHRNGALVGATEAGMPPGLPGGGQREWAEQQPDGAGADVNAEENGVQNEAPSTVNC